MCHERSVFSNARQENGERIEQFVIRLRKLSVYCEYGDNTNEHIRDQVITTCRSPKFRTKLLEKRELTLEKVLEMDKSREAVTHQSKQMEASSLVSLMDQVNTLRSQNYNRGRDPYRSSQNQSQNDYRSNNHNYNRKPANQQQQKHQFNSNNSQQRKNMCGRCGATGHAIHE